MAGDWLKIEHTTPDKPEILRLAALLRITHGDAFLMCFRLWRWADLQTRDGNAIGVTNSLLDSITGVTGSADALLAVGWLERPPDGSPEGLRLPNFERHISETAKTRALTTKRVAAHRRKRNADSVTQALHPALHERYFPVTQALPEKRREEKKEEEKTPLPPKGGKFPLPPELDTEELRRAWDDWQQHRRENRHALKPTTVKRQFAQLASWGPARAVAAIEYSITQGYTGLVEPPAPRNSRHAGNGASQATLDDMIRKAMGGRP